LTFPGALAGPAAANRRRGSGDAWDDSSGRDSRMRDLSGLTTSEPNNPLPQSVYEHPGFGRTHAVEDLVVQTRRRHDV
jgi:hypothetical protein